MPLLFSTAQFKSVNENKAQFHAFFILALSGTERSTSRSGHFSPSNQWTGGWVSPKIGLELVARTRIPNPDGNRTLTVQQVASPFTDYQLKGKVVPVL
jgi:hypothetical protein